MINPVVYSISLDIYKIGSQKVLSMVRGDTKRAIVIHLTENERPYSINEGCTAYFTAKKPDGNFIYNECEVDFKSNTITYNVTEQTTAVNGKVDCQLRLVGANGGIVSTPSFSLVVADLLYNEEPIVESSREFNALTSYIADLKNRVENGEFNGKSIYIKGSVSDPGELDEKITSSVAGDGYLADDNHLYVFDGTVFVDVGLVRGPRGLSGVHFGSGDMPEDCNVQIDPTGSAVTVVDEVIKDSKELVTSGAVERCVSEIESALERNEELSNTNKSTSDGHTQLLDEHAGQLGEHAELLGGHTDLINGKLSVYKSLTAIGVSAGSETIEDIALALPNKSMLFYAAGTAANADTYPETTPFAEIVVFKEDISRVIFQYISKTTAHVWVGVYSNTNTNGYWTGWKKIAISDDVDKAMRAYNSLSELGINYGEETLVGIFGKMESGSMLMCDITYIHANIYPATDGILEVLKVSTSRGIARFTGETGSIWECVFTMPIGGTVVSHTSWRKIAMESGT